MSESQDIALIDELRSMPTETEWLEFKRNVGSSKTELGRHPEKARVIWTRGNDWSAEVCEQARLDDLDPDALVKAREQFVIKHPDRTRIRQAVLPGYDFNLDPRTWPGQS